MPISPSFLEALAEKTLGFFSADEAEVRLVGGEDLVLRSANNDISSNGLVGSLSAHLTASFGKRSATISLNQTDEASLRAAVAKVEAMARLAPENPEHLPPVEPASSYERPPTWSEDTASMDPASALARVRPVLEAARRAKLETASFFERSVEHSVYANSRGVLVGHRGTSLGFSITARTAEGRGSGWASLQANDLADFDLEPVGDRALAKAAASRNAAARPAGRTTVVLEPAAARDLLGLLLWGLDRRDFDEGRSFLKGWVEPGEDPVGRLLFDERVTLLSDPMDSRAPCEAQQSGQARRRTLWIEKGVLRTLPVERYWAGKKGIPPQPWPGNLLFPGEGHSLDDLIARVEDGVLVSRLWYLRLVSPETLLYTGLTRDGTFAIRDGKIAGPVNNFRFNESPAKLLKNLLGSGVPERVLGSESSMPILAPPLLVRDFNLSSVSDAS